MTMTSDPLSMQSILQLMVEALPTHSKDDTASDISSSYEAVALFSHACMTAVGFRLIGFTEGQNIEAEFARLAPRLSSRWNSSFGSHSFLYAHSQSSMQYVLEVDRLGGKAEIRGIGLAEGAEKITRLEITAKDYISSSALPVRIMVDSDGKEDRSNLSEKLKDVFISPSRISDLATEFKLNIIQNLMPGLQKEGYEETSNPGRQAHAQREEEHQRRRNPPPDPVRDPGLPRPARPYPFNDQLAAVPRRPGPTVDFPPPDFEDELEINRPLRGMASLHPAARTPFNIGHNDLNPPGLGPNDPLRGSFVGGAPGGLGGGMHPTFDDPLFGGRGRGNSDFNPQAPPGARWDDVGPGRGPRSGTGGEPPNFFGGFGGNDFI